MIRLVKQDARRSLFDKPEDIRVICNPDNTANVSLKTHITNGTDDIVCATIECGPHALSKGSTGITCTSLGTDTVPGTAIVSMRCSYDTPSTLKRFVKTADITFNELTNC